MSPSSARPDDDRWQRIEEVFHRAADLAPTERADFLATVCAGDLDFRREVESLLANDDSHDNLIEAAVSAPTRLIN
jgi:hypothetical protein